jgi:hypothetical protein
MKKYSPALVALFLLIFGLQSPIPAHAADVLVNGSFSDASGGWQGASYSGQGNDACPNGEANIGTWAANTLSFSYIKTTVYQDVVISKPSTLKLTFNVKNRADQVNTQWFSADLGTSSTGNFTPTTSGQTVSLSYATTVPNQTVRVSFTGQDELFWAGCYASQVTSASLSVVAAAEPEKIFLPNDLLATAAPTFTKIGEYVSCSLGSYGYRSTRNNNGVITSQDLDSATILLRSNGEVIGSASTDNYTNSPRSILGIKDSTVDVKIVGGVASWKLASDSASAVISCQILAYKEHQMTDTTIK